MPTFKNQFPGSVIHIPQGLLTEGMCFCRPSVHADEYVPQIGETISVAEYFITQTEITVGQYKDYLHALSNQNSLHHDLVKILSLELNQLGDHYPLLNLPHHDQLMLCNHYGGKLPTPVQIEYGFKAANHDDNQTDCRLIKITRDGNLYTPYVDDAIRTGEIIYLESTHDVLTSSLDTNSLITTTCGGWNWHPDLWDFCPANRHVTNVLDIGASDHIAFRCVWDSAERE